ncbi:hypothetical protein D3C86_865390 [compost metagenome]
MLTVDGEGILLLAGDAVALSDVLGGDAHVIVVEGIGEAIMDHRVDHLNGSHAGAPAGVGHEVRGRGHVLHAAGDDDVGVSEQDGLDAEVHRLEARTADLVDGEGGHFGGDSPLDGGLTGRALAETGLQDVAHDDFVHLIGGDASPREGLADDGRAEIHGGDVLEGAAERPDGGADGAGDDDFTRHWVSF